MLPGSVHVFDDQPAASRAVAERLIARGTEALASAGVFRLALSGGSRVHVLYDILSAEYRARFDWSAVQVFFADERAVLPDSPDSNYRLVREHLVEPIGIPAANVHRFRGEADDLEDAAREYEPLLVQPLDLLLLGVGANGHTASLFPHSPLLAEYHRYAGAVLHAPEKITRRLTITPRVIGEAHEVGVLVTGDAVADAVGRALVGDTPVQDVPAVLLRSFPWYLDRAAAKNLPAL